MWARQAIGAANPITPPTGQRSESEATAADAFDQVQSDKGANKVDGRHQSRQPDSHRRVVESGHLNNRRAVIPAKRAHFIREFQCWKDKNWTKI